MYNNIMYEYYIIMYTRMHRIYNIRKRNYNVISIWPLFIMIYNELCTALVWSGVADVML